MFARSSARTGSRKSGRVLPVAEPSFGVRRHEGTIPANPVGLQLYEGEEMNLERVVFGFFIILALTLNFVFLLGVWDEPPLHSEWILTITILVNLVATGLKLGDRSQVGALLLAASLVADLLLIAARVLWIVVGDDVAEGDAGAMVEVAALAGGALLANVISVVIVVGDTLMSRR